MTKNDQPLVQPKDILLAVSLLTRLPVEADHATRGSLAVWAYPLAGLVPAALAVLVGLFAQWLGLPAPICALLALAAMIATTGAMHEDGLADTADGFWGGWTVERRLEIMKDSQIGAYGVVGLILAFGLRWAALTWLFEAELAAGAILAAAVISRASMPVLMATLPHARKTGLSHSVGTVGTPSAAIAIVIAFVLGVLILGSGVFWAFIWAGLLTAGIGMTAQRKINGQTGDVLGCAQQVTEIAVLLTLVA